MRGLKGRAVQSFPSTEAILEAVATGREKAGYVISTRGAWLAHERWPGKLVFFRPPTNPWIAFPSAAAVRKTDGDLKDAIDRAWDELDRSGRLAQVFARWHIPYERVAAAETESRARPVSRSALACFSGSSRIGWAVGLLGWAAILQLQPAAVRHRCSAGGRPPADPDALAEGQALFRGLCSGCHGGAGRGGKGPDLTDNRWIHGGTDDDIARVIQNGVPKTTMKKLGDSLKQDQIRKLIAYIRSLARSPGESTWKPYIDRRSSSGPKALLRSQEQGPVREVP